MLVSHVHQFMSDLSKFILILENLTVRVCTYSTSHGLGQKLEHLAENASIVAFLGKGRMLPRLGLWRRKEGTVARSHSTFSPLYIQSENILADWKKLLPSGKVYILLALSPANLSAALQISILEM